MFGQAWRIVIVAMVMLCTVRIWSMIKAHSTWRQLAVHKGTSVEPMPCLPVATMQAAVNTANTAQTAVAIPVPPKPCVAQVDQIQTETATVFAAIVQLPLEEEQQLDAILSRAEIDALLGARVNSAVTKDSGRLTTALQVAVQSLQTMVEDLGTWAASDLKPSTWDGLAELYTLAHNALFLLLEARVPGGSLYVIATTVAACRLDEAAALVLETATDETAFIGWRRVVEYMLSDFCLTLLPNQQDLTFSPRTLPPRRWSPNNAAYYTTPANELLITTKVQPEGDPDNAFYLLLPATTLRELSGSDLFVPAEDGAAAELETTAIENDPVAEPPAVQTQATAVEQDIAPASQIAAADENPVLVSDFGMLADIPLNVATLCSVDSLPIRAVATWRPGMQIPVAFKPGSAAKLLVNGKCLAQGSIVSDASGQLMVEITSLQADT